MSDPIADEWEGEMSMSIDTHTLMWLFPISFMFHDFEEIIFWERWMNKNGGEIKRRVPPFLAKHVDTFVGKSTAQISLVVCLIFSLTVLSVFLATVYGTSSFFLLVSGMFFVHGFGHIGQSIVLRRYVPGVITSALIVIPYGLVLSWRLIGAGMVDLAATDAPATVALKQLLSLQQGQQGAVRGMDGNSGRGMLPHEHESSAIVWPMAKRDDYCGRRSLHHPTNTRRRSDLLRPARTLSPDQLIEPPRT